MSRSRVFIVCGLGFGDEGKGTVTDFLCRQHAASLVVRYNGGPQAAHNVITPDGVHHCFAQFGAGSFVPGTRTLLTRPMLISPENLIAEGLELEGKGVRDPFGALGLDPACAVVTPFQQMVGRMSEIARGAGRSGSCGKGVGQTVLDRERGLGLTVADLRDASVFDRKLRELAAVKSDEADVLLKRCATPEMRACRRFFDDKIDLVRLRRNYRRFDGWLPDAVTDGAQALAAAAQRGTTMVFEGAQGALLDRQRGFTPFITKSRTTAANAQDLLAPLAAAVDALKVGILRAYGHRHGPGPFVTEDVGLAARFGDRLNPTNRWQGAFRVGWLDLPALRYGLSLNGGVDALAVTGLDRLSGLPTIRVCEAYDYLGVCARLDPWFDWTPVGSDRAHIRGFRPPTGATPPAGLLAEILAACRPVWREVPGWSQDLTDCREPDRLPSSATDLLELISRSLGAPVRIVSVGPRADQKFFL